MTEFKPKHYAVIVLFVLNLILASLTIRLGHPWAPLFIALMFVLAYLAYFTFGE